MKHMICHCSPAAEAPETTHTPAHVTPALTHSITKPAHSHMHATHTHTHTHTHTQVQPKVVPGLSRFLELKEMAKKKKEEEEKRKREVGVPPCLLCLHFPAHGVISPMVCDCACMWGVNGQEQEGRGGEEEEEVRGQSVVVAP